MEFLRVLIYFRLFGCVFMETYLHLYGDIFIYTYGEIFAVYYRNILYIEFVVYPSVII